MDFIKYTDILFFKAVKKENRRNGMSFLDERYLLSSETAFRLYKSVEKLPIMDVHNHADVQWIADNRKFSDPWQLFAASDHYVWEMMRACGVPERLITGDAPAYDKWMALAEIFPECVGNPIYEWIHLDLRQLGLGGVLLSRETGEKLWNDCCHVLAQDECSPLNLIRRMNIETMCSTDDPADLLLEHKKANELLGRRVIRPTWRPDKVMKIGSPAWFPYLDKLSSRFHLEIKCLKDLIKVLEKSHAYFAEAGAIASDHALEYALDGDASEAEAE